MTRIPRLVCNACRCINKQTVIPVRVNRVRDSPINRIAWFVEGDRYIIWLGNARDVVGRQGTTVRLHPTKPIVYEYCIAINTNGKGIKAYVDWRASNPRALVKQRIANFEPVGPRPRDNVSHGPGEIIPRCAIIECQTCRMTDRGNIINGHIAFILSLHLDSVIGNKGEIVDSHGQIQDVKVNSHNIAAAPIGPRSRSNQISHVTIYPIRCVGITTEIGDSPLDGVSGRTKKIQYIIWG